MSLRHCYGHVPEIKAVRKKIVPLAQGRRISRISFVLAISRLYRYYVISRSVKNSLSGANITLTFKSSRQNDAKEKCADTLSKIAI